MKNVSQVVKELRRLGFRCEQNTGSSLMKLYPPDPAKPFYSFHVGERGLHPLRRFAKKNWGLDLAHI